MKKINNTLFILMLLFNSVFAEEDKKEIIPPADDLMGQIPPAKLEA